MKLSLYKQMRIKSVSEAIFQHGDPKEILFYISGTEIDINFDIRN